MLRGRHVHTVNLRGAHGRLLPSRHLAVKQLATRTQGIMLHKAQCSCDGSEGQGSLQRTTWQSLLAQLAWLTICSINCNLGRPHLFSQNASDCCGASC